MLVIDIIQAKGAGVATVAPDATVTVALAELERHNVGALVVTSGSSILGIISERDIVRALARRGPGALDDQVDSLMTTDVVTCTRRSTAAELMELMTDRRIRHVPVMDEAGLDGIVSIGDVVKVRVTELEVERQQLAEYITNPR